LLAKGFTEDDGSNLDVFLEQIFSVLNSEPGSAPSGKIYLCNWPHSPTSTTGYFPPMTKEGANKSLGTKTHHSKLLILNG